MKKMKRIILVFALSMFLISDCFGAEVATKISGNTVTFSTTASAVTFNSVTNRIVLRNESPAFDCYVDIKGVDSNGAQRDANVTNKPYTALVKVSAASSTPNYVELDFATKNLGFISADGSGNITYIVTGEAGDL